MLRLRTDGSPTTGARAAAASITLLAGSSGAQLVGGISALHVLSYASPGAACLGFFRLWNLDSLENAVDAHLHE